MRGPNWTSSDAGITGEPIVPRDNVRPYTTKLDPDGVIRTYFTDNPAAEIEMSNA